VIVQKVWSAPNPRATRKNRRERGKGEKKSRGPQEKRGSRSGGIVDSREGFRSRRLRGKKFFWREGRNSPVEGRKEKSSRGKRRTSKERHREKTAGKIVMWWWGGGGLSSCHQEKGNILGNMEPKGGKCLHFAKRLLLGGGAPRGKIESPIWKIAPRSKG